MNTKDLSSIIVRPRITEKASVVSAQNVYTFEISKDATKSLIKKAIKEIYNVTPVRVNMLSIPSKKVMSRGKPGVKKGSRKAYVQLKDGDKIEFV